MNIIQLREKKEADVTNLVYLLEGVCLFCDSKIH